MSYVLRLTPLRPLRYYRISGWSGIKTTDRRKRAAWLTLAQAKSIQRQLDQLGFSTIIVDVKAPKQGRARQPTAATPTPA